MTTSTVTRNCVEKKFNVGSMYEYNDLIVMCCSSGGERHPHFSGVVVYAPEKSDSIYYLNGGSLNEYKIGKYFCNFAKFYFNEFNGEVTLKS
jgi:hypothetical protein